MTYAPHTEDDVNIMLAELECNSIEDLFSEVPEKILIDNLSNVKDSISEPELFRLIKDKFSEDEIKSNFIGAGSYEHYIPPTVWEIGFRGEFLTAYTPYQAEASQGTLQLIYEYQSMMSELMGHNVSNASLYDGATSCAEAILMGIRSKGKRAKKRVLLPRNMHPAYTEVVRTLIEPQGIDVVFAEYDKSSGNLSDNVFSLEPEADVMVISQPNFFGGIESVDELTNWAHKHEMIVVAVVNPVFMSITKPAGVWGDNGADIACGEGQSLGLPLASGGPYYGFLTSKQKYVRHMPGRIVGKSKDTNGIEAFTLTLQAREQHIRRSKATSNICTNQGLMVTGSTIYMCLLGSEGLERIAHSSMYKARKLQKMLEDIGVKISFTSPYYCEFVIDAEGNLGKVKEVAKKSKVSVGYDLGHDFPDLDGNILCCVTDVKSDSELEAYVEIFKEAGCGK